jgi:hypothetical protein
MTGSSESRESSFVRPSLDLAAHPARKGFVRIVWQTSADIDPPQSNVKRPVAHRRRSHRPEGGAVISRGVLGREVAGYGYAMSVRQNGRH